VSESAPVLRNISDTARWVAVYRARETERPDALFRDPFARRLAGERGEQIAAGMPFSDKHAWTWLARNILFDEYVTEQVQQGVDMVVNLAAGLDARPYRMALPPTLKWVEVDLPEILEYKEEILANDKPVCELERVRLNLTNVDGRRDLFARLGQEARKVLIVTEGLLPYLSPEEVGGLATDLAKPASFQRWAHDLMSPGLKDMLQKQFGDKLDQAGAPFKFAPAEGPAFFAKYGWKSIEVRSLIKKAARLKRLPFLMRLIALLPESKGPQGNRPWSAICLEAKDEAAPGAQVR
jgi:methyltransferase (TIGR00027 family)